MIRHLLNQERKIDYDLDHLFLCFFFFFLKNDFLKLICRVKCLATSSVH